MAGEHGRSEPLSDDLDGNKLLVKVIKFLNNLFNLLGRKSRLYKVTEFSFWVKVFLVYLMSTMQVMLNLVGMK